MGQHDTSGDRNCHETKSGHIRVLSPHRRYATYNDTQWIYQYGITGVGTTNKPYVLLNISAKGKDGFTYSYTRALMDQHMISLAFKGNVLKDFSLY